MSFHVTDQMMGKRKYVCQLCQILNIKMATLCLRKGTFLYLTFARHTVKVDPINVQINFGLNGREKEFDL